jgi:tRNA threonylcarbamoyladenosine biosynthesis protein TsaB
MIWTLGIDTSSFELGVGLFCDNVPAASFSRYATNSHAEHISQCVDFMLHSAGIGPADIGRVGVGVGPGSFTGLRIGIAFVKGFCFGRKTKIAPLSSLEVAAAALAGSAAQGSITVGFDARRNEVFTARFSVEDGSLRRDTPDSLVPASEFYASIRIADTLVTDCLGYGKSTVFATIPPAARHLALETVPVQRGLAAALLAAHMPENAGEWLSPVDVLPRYLRGSAAEEKVLA